MSNFSTILHKRSSVANNVPTPSSLSAGEIAINTADGKLFVKTTGNAVETFLNASQQPYSLNTNLSSTTFQNGNNSVSGIVSTVLAGVDNDVSGAGSTVVNGSDNDIQGDYAFIGNGANNKILSAGDYGAILGGQNNTLNHDNSFILGSNITSHAPNFTYVNNLSVQGVLYGDGSNLTGISGGGGGGIDTNMRNLSSRWESTYTSVCANSSSWDSVYASVDSASANWNSVYNNSFNFALTSDARFFDSRTPTGAASGDLDGTYPNPTIKNSVALFGQPTAPTAAVGTHTTQIATTEFVQNNKGDTYFTTSTSTNTIDNTNGKTFVLASSSLSYTPTQDVTITWDGDPFNYHMHCTVVSFSGYNLVVNVNSHSGNGTHSNWTINVGGFTTQSGVLLQSNNLSDVASASTSLTNLGGVSTSRTISAGTGLTGGGDLTTDRTLSVVFGNTSATAVSGNDPRLSDERTPTAHKNSHAIGGTDLLSPSDIGAVDITIYQQASGNWQNVYSTVLTNSSTNWDNEIIKSYVDGGFLPVSGGTLTGNLSVLGELIYVDTSVAVVSAMYIDTNTILDPALRITQRGTGDVIRVEDSANPDTTPFIIDSDGFVGIGISSPNENLTVVGNISASGLFYGNGSNLTGIVAGDTEATTLVRSNSAKWESVYTTVSTQSGSWGGGSGGAGADTDVRALTGNWQSAYTTVSSMSASWQTTFAASSAYVSSNPTGITGASALTKLLQITQAGYNSITPASDTLYIIVG